MHWATAALFVILSASVSESAQNECTVNFSSKTTSSLGSLQVDIFYESGSFRDENGKINCMYDTRWSLGEFNDEAIDGGRRKFTASLITLDELPSEHMPFSCVWYGDENLRAVDLQVTVVDASDVDLNTITDITVEPETIICSGSCNIPVCGDTDNDGVVRANDALISILESIGVQVEFLDHCTR